MPPVAAGSWRPVRPVITCKLLGGWDAQLNEEPVHEQHYAVGAELQHSFDRLIPSLLQKASGQVQVTFYHFSFPEKKKKAQTQYTIVILQRLAQLIILLINN